ncbi:MAG: CHAT domain-containing protein [Acetobacteraceae bacterium]
MTRVLLVSPDPHWLESLQIELEPMGIQAVGRRTAAEALEALDVVHGHGHFDGSCISALLADGQSERDWVVDFRGLVDALREGMAPGSRVLLWSRFLSKRRKRLLAGLFEKDPRTTQVWADDPTTLAAALSSAVTATNRPPRWAKVELEIGAEAIHVQVTVDGKGAPLEENLSNPARWMLNQLEEFYREWKPWEKRDKALASPTPGWNELLEKDGISLAREFQYGDKEKLHKLVEWCVESVEDIGNVHFRFTLLADEAEQSNPYQHVPFELLYDPPKKDFVRALSPVARRIHLSPGAVIHKASAEDSRPQPLNGPVLFVQSDAHGKLVGSGITFRKSDELALDKLEGLEAELRGARSAWKRKNKPIRSIKLRVRSCHGDALKQLCRALSPPDKELRPQILHFAGHSVCHDRGELYLVLPGSQDGALKLVDFKDFANLVKETELRLLILSSCESTSPQAVFRVAQCGVPAVIGFRWEVPDQEAAHFTACLHERLATGDPLACAFHSAVQQVRAKYPGSLAFASAMLVTQ